MAQVQIEVNVNGVPTKMILQRDFYLNPHNTALRLYHHNEQGDIQLWSTLTTNLKDEQLLPEMVMIKNWGDGEGNLDLLVKNGIISEPLYYLDSGYVQIPVCFIEAKELLDK